MPTVELVLDAKTKKAIKGIGGFAKSAKNSIKGVEKSFSLLKVAAAGAVGFLAGRAIISGIKEITDAAAVQEDAIKALDVALQASGLEVEKTSASFQAFASEIQGATKFGDEAILQNAALIQSLGQLDEEGLKGATTAATDLAAALNIDLRSAATLVGKAAAGEVSSFSRYGLSIKKADSNAATFANTLDAINSKFGGAAAAQVNTYSGAMQQLANIQGDLNEELGFTITENKGVVGAIKGMSDGYKLLISFVQDNRDQIGGFITSSIKGIVTTIPKAIKSLSFFAEGFYALKFAVADTAAGLTEFVIYMLETSEVVNKLIDGYRVLKNVIAPAAVIKAKDAWSFFTDSGSEYLKTVKQTIKEQKRLNANIAALETTAEVIDNAKLSLEGLKETLSDTANKSGKQFEGVKQAIDSATQLAEGFSNKVVEGIDKQTNALKDTNAALGKTVNYWKDFKSFLSGISFAGVISGLKSVGPGIKSFFNDMSFEGVFNGVVGGLKAVTTGEFGAALGTTIAGAISNGASAAKDLIAKGLGAVGDAFLPGLGGFITPIARAAAEGPEKAKEQAKIFAETLVTTIPAIIDALIAATPVLIDTLVDSLITKGGILKIAEALVIGIAIKLPAAIAKSFVRAIRVTGEAFANMLRIGFTKAFSGIRDFFTTFKMRDPQWFADLKNAKAFKTPQWLKNITIKTPPWITNLINSINNLAGTFTASKSGKIGGTLGQITEGIKKVSVNKILGRGATGGVVPKGFPNDTFPAALTSDEFVLRSQTADNLQDAIDNLATSQGGGDNAVLLARILDLLSQPMQVNTVAEVDGDSFANIMLSLSRQNARTAA